MNIFILSPDPYEAALMHCDKHVPKMCVESAQMLSAAVLRHDPDAPDKAVWPTTAKGTHYKASYPHHPCTKWAGDSRANFKWLAKYGLALCQEFFVRFGKRHRCQDAIEILLLHVERLPVGELTPFHQAMPVEHRNEDPVVAYRSYYRTKMFAEWSKGQPAPAWW